MDATNKSDLDKITEGHIFYEFQDEEVYFNNLVNFIQSGIENKQQVLIIENMRNLPKVRTKIDLLFNKEQQRSIRLVNNFEYYLSNGDFNTQTILNHFQQDLSLLKKDNSAIRTWAHVEWASSEPDAELLKEFETTADYFVSEEKMLSVCAYSSSQLSSDLTTVLVKAHSYVMTDDSFLKSSFYIEKH